MVRFVIASLALAAGIAGFVGTSNKADAGPIPGRPVTGTFTVEAKDTDVIRIGLKGGELALISLEGDGTTDLELRVYDEFDNLLGANTLGVSDKRSVIVSPKFTGNVKIKVKNNGLVYNRYTLRVI